jgi:hypothetical protein
VKDGIQLVVVQNGLGIPVMGLWMRWEARLVTQGMAVKKGGGQLKLHTGAGVQLSGTALPSIGKALGPAPQKHHIQFKYLASKYEELLIKKMKQSCIAEVSGAVSGT